MTEAVNVTDLKEIVDRVNKRMDDRDEISDDIRDLFTLAKSRGYNTKAMRRVISDMRSDPEKRKALEADVDLYRTALGSDGGAGLVDPAVTKALAMREAGSTYREIEKATGVKKSTLHRLSQDSVGRDDGLTAGASIRKDEGTASDDVLAPAESLPPTLAPRAEVATPAVEPPQTVLLDGEATVPATALPLPSVQAAVVHLRGKPAPELDEPGFLNRRGARAS